MELDPAVAMRDHQPCAACGEPPHCLDCAGTWPCLPYLLAEALAASEAKVARLASALERTEGNFRSAVSGHPVRDMGENLAENRAALASR